MAHGKLFCLPSALSYLRYARCRTPSAVNRAVKSQCHSPDSGYQYPTNIRRSVTMLWVFVLTQNVLEYLLAWARAVFAWLDLPLRLPDVTFLQPFQNVSSNLLTAHLGLLVALICVRAVAFLAPRVDIRSNGLLTTTALGRRLVPYGALRGVRSTELPNGRFVVGWIRLPRCRSKTFSPR